MELPVLTTGEVAAHFGVPLRLINDLFYQGRLDASRCPVRAGRRLIPRAYLRRIEAVLEAGGLLDAAAAN